jgi:hypothetical protein
MADFGMIMLFGMAAGLVTNAGLDSTVNTQKACDQIDKAKQNRSDVESQYENLIKQVGSLDENIKAYNESLVIHRSSMISATNILKETFKQTQLKNIISLCVFLIVLILGFIFKYFNVFGNLWNFFVKN